jgi:hypothetical protein
MSEEDNSEASDAQSGPERPKRRLDQYETGLVFAWIQKHGAGFKGKLTDMAQVIRKEYGFTVPVNPAMLSTMLAKAGIREKKSRPTPVTPAEPAPRPSNDVIALLIAVADKLIATGSPLTAAAVESLERLRKLKPMGRPKKSKDTDTDDGEATPV